MSQPLLSRENRLEQLFLDVVEETDTVTREARLRAVCHGDDALLEEVRRLLDTDASNDDGLLGHFTTSLDDDDASGKADSGEDIPLTIGGYAVIRYVDGGAIGTVYEARHTATGRRAAVKLIRVGLATARQRARFQIESELLARLSDPGIARLFDAGEAVVTYADGQHAQRVFIAMEFVDGADIVAHCRTDQLSTTQRVGLMIAAARAVQHAHERGVIHRDLKPSHILVARSDARPRVVDFGIATVIDSTARMTMTGAVLGTPAYMSPEQRAGQREQVGPPSDVYSLAAVFYEMLAGRPLMDRSAAMSFRNHPLHEPLRLRTAIANLPRDLDAVIHKALSIAPTDRYPTARDLADDLQRWADSRPVTARPPSLLDRTRLQARRRPRLVTAVSVAIAASLTLGTATAWQAIRASRAERAALLQLASAKHEQAIADRERTRADHQSRVSAAVSRFLSQEVIGRADSGKQVRDDGQAKPDLTLKEAIDRAAVGLENSFDGDADTQVAVRRAVADAYQGLGEPDKAVAQYELARTLLQKAHGADAAEMLDLESELGQALVDANRTADAVTLLQHVYTAAIAKLGDSSPTTVGVLDHLNNAMLDSVGPTDETVRLLRLGVDASQRVLGSTDLRTGDQMWDLALALSERSDKVGAARVQRDLAALDEAALVRLRRESGPDDSDTIDVEDQLGETYVELGQFDHGLPLLRDVLARHTRLEGPDHINTINSTTHLAVALQDADQPDEALTLIESTVAHNLRVHGPDHIDTLGCQWRKATLLADMGKNDQAEPILRDIVARAQHLHYQSPDSLKAFIEDLNKCLTEQGKPPYTPPPVSAPTTLPADQ